eukprot:1588082-Pyramimonas_sp.AAC.1
MAATALLSSSGCEALESRFGVLLLMLRRRGRPAGRAPLKRGQMDPRRAGWGRRTGSPLRFQPLRAKFPFEGG